MKSLVAILILALVMIPLAANEIRYLYAGRVYYPLFKILRAKEGVIFGVTHGTVRQEIGDPHNILILDEFKLWTGLSEPQAIWGLREYLKEHLDKAAYAGNIPFPSGSWPRRKSSA